MILPEDLEEEFWQELKAFEEEQKVTYVTNAERIGRKIGIQIGLKDGAEENSRSIGLRMLKKGMDLETIAELTQLSPEQIQQLQAQMAQT